MTDRDALYAAICAAPDEDTPRLAFADFLQEEGGKENVARRDEAPAFVGFEFEFAAGRKANDPPFERVLALLHARSLTHSMRPRQPSRAQRLKPFTLNSIGPAREARTHLCKKCQRLRRHHVWRQHISK